VPSPAPQPAAAPQPATAGPVTRPNGQLYQPRELADMPDVEALRELREEEVPTLLAGPPGTGKTSLIETAFGDDLITVADDGDTTAADLAGEYTQRPDGTFEFIYGPLIRAMTEGKVLFIDDATLISPAVLAVAYPAMDGRREITVKAHKGETIKAAKGFHVVAGHNPGVHGAILTEALASRFAVKIKVSTDYDLAHGLGIDPRAISAARDLAGQQANDEIGWAPQLRELHCDHTTPNGETSHGRPARHTAPRPPRASRKPPGPANSVRAPGRAGPYRCRSAASMLAAIPYLLGFEPASSMVGRDELAATVAALGGEAGESMDRATRRAEQHAARLMTQAAGSGRTGQGRRGLAGAGLDAIAEVIGRYRHGGRPVTDQEAAWLTVALRDLRVRDDAWARMDPAHRAAHQRLWTDLTRRARPGYVPGPASLLAFTAWQSGNGALANVALDRALADDPQYSMANLLRQVITSGAPPSLARVPMTPEQVAASYEIQDGEAGNHPGSGSRHGRPHPAAGAPDPD
jgi:hypothetical protein